MAGRAVNRAATFVPVELSKAGPEPPQTPGSGSAWPAGFLEGAAFQEEGGRGRWHLEKRGPRAYFQLGPSGRPALGGHRESLWGAGAWLGGAFRGRPGGWEGAHAQGSAGSFL